MIPTNRMLGQYRNGRPHDLGRSRLVRRVLIIAAVATPFLAVFWFEVLKGVLLYLVYVWAFLNFPVTVFAALASIVFAIGWYLPLWPGKAWRRASVFLGVVIVLHTGWFLFGWVTFHPLCSIEVGIGGSTGNRAMMGDLDPYHADLFKRGLAVSWGEAAVQQADAHTVLVRPAFALLENEWNWNISYHAASGPLPPQLAERRDADCLAIEQNAMLDGKATRWRSGWGLWPWDTIDEDEGFARWLRGLYKDS
jgi:hypothetical protein